MSKVFQLYPSGFLGSGLVAQTPMLPEGISGRTSQWVGAVQEPNLMHGMNDVEALWQQVRAGDPIINTFEFREQILKTAIAAFPTAFIGDWVREQAASPCFGDYHLRWIDETVQFVLLGKSREYTYNVWVGLLDAAPMKERVKLNVLTQGFFHRGGPYAELSTRDFIGQWCTRDRGVLDLLESMHVLFGTR